MADLNVGDAWELLTRCAAAGARDIFVPRSVDERARAEHAAKTNARAEKEQAGIQRLLESHEASSARLMQLAVKAKRDNDTARVRAAARGLKESAAKTAQLRSQLADSKRRNAPIKRAAALNARLQESSAVMASLGRPDDMKRLTTKAQGMFDLLDSNLDAVKELDDVTSQFDERTRLDTRETRAEDRRRRKERLGEDLEDEKEEITDEEEEREMLEAAAAERRRAGLPEKRHPPGSIEAIMEEIESAAKLETLSESLEPPFSTPVRYAQREAPRAVYEGGDDQGYPPDYFPSAPNERNFDRRDPRDPPPDGGSPSCAMPMHRATNRPTLNPFYVPQA